jgi:hypothetical protein
LDSLQHLLIETTGDFHHIVGAIVPLCSSLLYFHLYLESLGIEDQSWREEQGASSLRTLFECSSLQDITIEAAEAPLMDMSPHRWPALRDHLPNLLWLKVHCWVSCLSLIT